MFASHLLPGAGPTRTLCGVRAGWPSSLDLLLPACPAYPLRSGHRASEAGCSVTAAFIAFEGKARQAKGFMQGYMDLACIVLADDSARACMPSQVTASLDVKLSACGV